MLDAETDVLHYLENAGTYLSSFWTLEINQILTSFSLLSVLSSWPTSPHISWKVQCVCSETLLYPCWCFLYLQLLLLFYSFLLSINIFKSLLFKKKVCISRFYYFSIFQNQTSLLIFSTISHEAQNELWPNIYHKVVDCSGLLVTS